MSDNKSVKQYDIVALGESLIDFVVKPGAQGSILLEGNAGGAPANVLAMAGKLGHKTAFIGKVGRDVFGDYLRENVKQSGVDTVGMVAGSQPTTLAMVSLDAGGNRSFSFYRNQTADVMLQTGDVPPALLAGCRVFHFGSVSMTADPARTTTLAAALKARDEGALISFDPNHRPLLWDDEADALEAMNEGLELADYVKLSDEEAEMLTGERDPEKAALSLAVRFGFKFIAVTLGPKGCVGVSQTARARKPTYNVETINTTGAGDAFWGAVLHRLIQAGDAPLDEALVGDILCYGNAAGSLVTRQHGAIAPQPTDKEIRHCMKTVPFLEV